MPPQLPAEPERASLARPSRALSDWFTTPQGAYVLEWERARLDDLVCDLFGYYAVQVGLPDLDLLRENRIPWRTVVSLDGRPGVVADAHELPFAAESLDLVVLPHFLEAAAEPHQILREVERVLRPEGALIVTGFNPLSLWGVKRMFMRTQEPPWNAEFVSVLRMKDWLKLLNFEIRGGVTGCYRPPFASEKWLSRSAFLDYAGERWWPIAGALYIMHARKRVAGMRLITPARRRKLRESAVLAPTARGMFSKDGTP